MRRGPRRARGRRGQRGGGGQEWSPGKEPRARGREGRDGTGRHSVGTGRGSHRPLSPRSARLACACQCVCGAGAAGGVGAHPCSVSQAMDGALGPHQPPLSLPSLFISRASRY